MCFNISYAKKGEYWQTRFGAEWEGGAGEKYAVTYFNNAAAHPECPVITNEDKNNIQMLEWGLIPHWVKDWDKAVEIRRGTVNARNDTIFEKPAFRSSIMKRRCLVLADGFYEWRSEGKRKIPYRIKMKSDEGFAIAGVWDTWKLGDEEKKTFSVITTEANPLLAHIHNVKMRMPAILRKEDEKRWLEEGLTRGEIEEMLKPIDENLLEAFPVSKLASDPQANRNVPEVMKPEKAKQQTLF